MIRSILHKVKSGAMLLMCGILMQSSLAGSLWAANEEAQARSIHDVYVSLDIQNAGITEFFAEVEKQTDFSFVYNQHDLSDVSTISVNETNKSLAKVLEQVSKELQA